MGLLHLADADVDADADGVRRRVVNINKSSFARATVRVKSNPLYKVEKM